MKKILINAPILSRSGYGEMARFALQALRQHEDKFDIYVNALNWGQTGFIFEETEEYNYITQLRIKTEQYVKLSGGNPQFDVSLQITIPNEWKKMAPINIGYTAGIETTHVSPAWLEPSQQMDKIIVISEHAKHTFENTVFGDDKGNHFKITVPIEVVHFPWKQVQDANIDLDLSSEFNFLTVNQWGPRKNIEGLISAFIDEFRDEDVGLVIKTNKAADSQMDKTIVDQQLTQLVASKGPKKCKVHLIHGTLTEKEMHGLYKHPKIKAFVTATHGEGFGLPIFEAVNEEMPIIATNWSGHLDFLSGLDKDGELKPMFAKIDYQIKPIQEQFVWAGVMEKGTGWAYPEVSSIRTRMREVYKDYPRFKSWSKKVSAYNKDKFEQQKIFDRFIGAVQNQRSIDEQIIFTETTPELPVDVKKISFCISTNGKKADKTAKTIASIKKTLASAQLTDSEIIVCGVVSPFKDVGGIKLVEASQDAETGMLAKLRNTAAEHATGDAIVFLDDDIIFEEGWAARLLQFSKEKHWDILGNKILLPDGGRYWDRAILNPHQMVSYDFVDTDPRLYQTGCFWIVRAEVFSKHKWDSSIEYYAQRNGKVNEDVEYSDRLKKAGYKLKFDEKNTVWHWDDNYQEVMINPLASICLKKDMIPANMLKELAIKPEFNKLVDYLSE